MIKLASAFFLLALIGCRAPGTEPVQASVEDSCLAAAIRVGVEEARLNFLYPSEQPKTEIHLCREIPTQLPKQAIILVGVTRQVEDKEVEDLFVGTMFKHEEGSWDLIGTQPIHTDLELGPSRTVQDR